MRPASSAAATRSAVLAAAQRLMAQHGIHGVTIADIAAAASVSPATVSGHLGTRAQLRAAVVEAEFGALLERAGVTVADRRLTIDDDWADWWHALVDGLERHPLAVEVLAVPDAPGAPKVLRLDVVTSWTSRLADAIEHLRAASPTPPRTAPEVPSLVVAEGTVTLCAALVLAHVQLGVADDVERLAAILQVMRLGAELDPMPSSLSAASVAPPPSGWHSAVESTHSMPPDVGGKAGVTRGRLIAAAVRIFAAVGFRSTSMAQVARDVGLSPAAAFQHFSSKEELFAAAFDQDAMNMIAMVGEVLAEVDVIDRWPRVVELMWSRLAEFPLLHRVIGGREPALAPSLLGTAAIRLGVEGLTGRLEAGQVDGSVRMDVSAPILAEGLIEVALCLLVAWSQGGLDHEPAPGAAWSRVLARVLEPRAS